MNILTKISYRLMKFKIRKNLYDVSKDGKLTGFSTMIDGTRTQKNISKMHKHFKGTNVPHKIRQRWYEKKCCSVVKPVDILGKYWLSIWEAFDNNTTYEYIITPKKFEIKKYQRGESTEIILSKESYEHISTEEKFNLMINHNIIDIDKESIDNIRKVLSKKKRAIYNYSI